VQRKQIRRNGQGEFYKSIKPAYDHLRIADSVALNVRVTMFAKFIRHPERFLLFALHSFVADHDGCAQNFSKGDDVIGPIIGIGGQYTTYTIQTPVVGIAYEHGVTQLGAGVLGLGAYVGYKNLLYRSLIYVGEAEWNYSYLIVGVRGAWHWNQWHNKGRLDTYGGLMVHYNSVTATYTGPVLAAPGFTAKSGVDATLYAGGRYRLGAHWGIQGELGFGSAILNLGAAYKF